MVVLTLFSRKDIGECTFASRGSDLKKCKLSVILCGLLGGKVLLEKKQYCFRYSYFDISARKLRAAPGSFFEVSLECIPTTNHTR